MDGAMNVHAALASDLANHRAVMVHAYPDTEFGQQPILLPDPESDLLAWQVWWPISDERSTGFMWVSPDGQVVITEFLPTPEDFLTPWEG